MGGGKFQKELESMYKTYKLLSLVHTFKYIYIINYPHIVSLQSFEPKSKQDSVVTCVAKGSI